MATNMGIGKLGDPTTIIKRKFRYDLTIFTPQGIEDVPTHYVKLANRPELDIDELELQFLNASTWIPGKGRWQPLNITYIDVGNADMQGLYDWVASVYNFQQYYPVTGLAGATGSGGEGATGNLTQTERKGWDAVCEINMYDGCGLTIETWTLGGCFPQRINFGDLDYSSPDEATIELTIRFDKVNISKGSSCGVTPNGQCKGCGD